MSVSIAEVVETCQAEPCPHSSDTETEETDDSETLETVAGEEEDGAGEGPKRRKKRKKKKKRADGAGAGPSSSGESTVEPAVDKAEAEKRFHDAMESLKSGDEMWVQLGNANIYDAKTKKLVESLLRCSSVTSVDLSSNHIGDEGIKAIVSALQGGGMSELISLDLRGNDLSDHSLAQLELLRRQRKLLTIDFGPLMLPGGPSEAASDEDGTDGWGHAYGNGLQPGHRLYTGEGTSPPMDMQEITRNPMFQRYFQTHDEAEDGAEAAEVEIQPDIPPPEELWEQVREAASPSSPVSGISLLSSLLRCVAAVLEKEVGGVTLEEQSHQDFRPHVRHTLLHLSLLAEILAQEPAPVTTQFSSTPQPAVGSHRVWASEIVSLLMMPGSPVIEQAISEVVLVPKLVALAAEHPHSNALQCRVVQVLRSSYKSRVESLLSQLLQPELLPQLAAGGAPPAPLQRRIAELAEANVDLEVGRRSSVVGFVTEVAKVLLECCDREDELMWNAPVGAALDADEVWSSSVAEGGAVARLLAEQQDDLCGPRPVRPLVVEGEQGELMLPANNMLTGPQLLALLQNMGSLGQGPVMG